MEIEDYTYHIIQRLCASGDQKASVKNYDEAVRDYWTAYNLIPNPKGEYGASTWILIAMADIYFLTGEFESCLGILEITIEFPDSAGNSFFHLRKGQSHFELGHLEKATENLLRAYDLEDSRIFENENSKYFEFLKSQVPPPAKGWELKLNFFQALMSKFKK